MRFSKMSYAVFLLPVLVAFGLIVLIPAVLGISYSFTDWQGITDSFRFIGLDRKSVV